MLTHTNRLLDAVVSVICGAVFLYMAYATIFGPYKTTIVHLSLFALAMFTIFFLKGDGDRGLRSSALLLASDVGFATAAAVGFGYVILHFERLVNVWGATFLTPVDLVIGTVLIVVVIEACRRQSWTLAILSLLGVAYMLFGSYMPQPFTHPGFAFDRFIYLTVYTTEGLFGAGLMVGASYLFMFMMLSSALQLTGTGALIMDLANGAVGRYSGGAAKSAMLASAGLGTMTGSSIGNVLATGIFTIPLMIRTGFKPHVAAAVETNTSEGAQLVPPIMGAGVFIMAQITGIPYAAIVIAAIMPAFLYYFSLFWVVHVEGLRAGAAALPEDQRPNVRAAILGGWHLLVAPAVLFYLLVGGGYTPAYASLVALIVSLVIGLLRSATRYDLRSFGATFRTGLIQAAAIATLVASIGLIQAAIMTTGLGPRLTEIILSVSGGSLLGTALMSIVAATIIGMGMPTPIAYLLLAITAAPALEAVGASRLGAHLFVFYFAIKSGSTPPVALVATVAASIAKANWWQTAVTAFVHALPGFIVALMFLYSPGLLFQGGALGIALALVSACVGVFAFTAALQGWMLTDLGPVQRLLLGAAGLLQIIPGVETLVVGLVALVITWALSLRQRPLHRSTES